MGSIYKITNTVNGKAYIGQTRQDAEKTRIPKHLSGKGSQLVKQAIEKYGKDAFTYEILHDGIIPEFLDDLEKKAIAKFNTMSPHGYNLESGGGSGSPSEETRRKMSEAKKGQAPWNKGKKLGPLPEETRRKMSKAHKGKKKPERTEEHRRKISEAHTGRKHSVEMRRKQSEAKKGNTYSLGHTPSQETRRKISRALTGITRSEETRRKISEGLKGHPCYKNRTAWNKGKSPSEETRRKMSEAKIGKKRPPFTEETRRKMSEANKGEKNHFYGKALSEEHRRKLSKAITGKKHSSESKQKMSDVRESAECKAVRKIFFSLPPDMDIVEKRKFLYQRFPIDPSPS